ncbi:MAG: AAA family ATPase, partial [Deltaproteobacteria bacterium]|jgi:hypothetical protein|nr:AAA family ATPase [Deltaproteobacteria bacterium]
MALKQLPLGNQMFPAIIDQNLFYADKTRYIYDLLQNSVQNYFLSRPRRFGKTLLLHTLAELFTGNRQRFEGLWIGRSNYDFIAYPTLFLTLSVKSNSPSALENAILGQLKKITPKGLNVLGDTSDAYFGNLIEALNEKFNSQVVVLIDEYDAPVTKNLANPSLAEANRDILHDFFATLKQPSVQPCIRFTMVTGITRYALTSLDSGPNQIIDISLKSEFAGICGFTVDEFDSLFQDRLESTLTILKAKAKSNSRTLVNEAGGITDSSTVADLRATIFKWYDGYNWGGQTKVLNPLSLLQLFQWNAFGSHWIRSGRPGHLTALIKERPWEFLEFPLQSYITGDIRKQELDHLEPASVLFHSGYLTLDDSIDKTEEGQSLEPLEKGFAYLRLPNYEVKSNYNEDCFAVVLDPKSRARLKSKRSALQEAILSRDAPAVQTIFSDLFGTITFHQRPDGEKAFHALAQMILSVMSLKVEPELAGPIGRLDIAVKLKSRVYGVIELKYCPNLKIKPKEEDKFLAVKAMERLPQEEWETVLANVARQKLKFAEISRILSATPKKRLPEAEANHLLAQAALTSLAEGALNKVLAKVAREKLSPEEIEKIFQTAGSSLEKSAEEIDKDLSKAAQGALDAIKNKDYHAVLKLRADEFIDLGMAIYGYGRPIKVVFDPKPTTKRQLSRK